MSVLRTTSAWLLLAMVAPAATLSFQPGSPTVGVGQMFTIDVVISGVTDLYAFQFDVVFTAGLLGAISISEGPFLMGGGATFFVPGTVDNLNGTLTATADTLLGPSAGVSGGGVLAQISFQALASGAADVTFGSVIVLDSNLADIPVVLTPAVVTIQDSGAIPEPSSWQLLALAMLAFILLKTRRGAAHKKKGPVRTGPQL